MGASIWDGNSGDIIEVVNADNTYLTQRYDTIAEGQTLFLLTSFNYAVGTNSLRVFLNGVRQVLTDDYLETNSSSFTFTSPIRATDIVDVEGIVGTSGAQNAIEIAEAAAAAAEAALAEILALSLPDLPLEISNGGTGQITKAAAFLALAPVPIVNGVIGSLDGVTYQILPAGVIPGADITVTTTLTATTLGYHMIAMTALGGSIILPSATTLTAGIPRAIFDNSHGLYPVAVRNAAGELLTGIAAGGIAELGLKSNATAAGVWSILGSGLEPGIISVDALLNTTSVTAALFQIPFVALTSETSLHFAITPTGIPCVFLVDNVGKTVTSVVGISSNTILRVSQCFRLNDTQAIVFFGITGTHSAAVITVSGTSPSYSLSVGAIVTLSVTMGGGLAWDAEDSVNVPKIVQLPGTSTFVATYVVASSGIWSVVALSVTGAVVTLGTPLGLTGSAAIQNTASIAALTSTSAISIVKSGGSAPYNIYVNVINVSGAVCTTPGSVSPGLNANNTLPSSFVVLSPTKIIIAEEIYSVTDGKAVVGTIAAGVLTFGALATFSPSNCVGRITYSADGANRNNPHLFPLGPNSALLWHYTNVGADVSRVYVLTESAGVITLASVSNNVIGETGSSTSAEFGVPLPLNTDSILSLIQEGGTANWRKKLIVARIIGSTLIVGYGANLPEMSVAANILEDRATRLSSGDIVLSSSTRSTSLTVIRSNGAAVNYRGTIRIPHSLVSPAAPMAVSSNRVVFLEAGHSTTTTPLLRVLNVEIAL